MSSSKLDAKHERTLRSLLKQPDNRRCAVCETLGPQYVVIDFTTFVCTNCSGIHRHFNHRCKGISMATFKPEEMRSIEEGGNAVAMAKYLAKWSPGDLPKPTDRNVTKVRDFIEVVFVQKRFYSEDAPVPSSLTRLQSTSSARSSASRDADPAVAPLVPHPGGSGNFIDLASPIKQAAPATAATAPPHPSAAAVPLHPAVQEDGWAAFGDAGTTNGQPEAKPAAPPHAAAGWAQSGAQPAAGALPGAHTQAAPAAAAGDDVGGGGGDPAGWQAFGEEPASANGAVKLHAADAAPAPVRKELPSDLFCELPPQAQAPPVFGSGARTAPAGSFAGGFPLRSPTDHARASFSHFSAGTFAGGPGGNHALPGGFYGGSGGGLQSVGSLVASSGGVLGSPEGSVRSAASEVAAPDPFSALGPVLRSALPTAASSSVGVPSRGVLPSGDAGAGTFFSAGGVPGGSFGPAPPGGSLFNQGGASVTGAPSVGSSASVPASPATPAPAMGFANPMASAPWGAAPAAGHGFGSRAGSAAQPPPGVGQGFGGMPGYAAGAGGAGFGGAPGFGAGTGGGGSASGGSSAFGGAAGPTAFNGSFEAAFPAVQQGAFYAQPHASAHAGAVQGAAEVLGAPLPQYGGAAFAAPKSSGNPFA